MITIKQDAQITFHHVGVQDALIMLPLMDELATQFREAARLLHEKGSEEQYKEYQALGLQLFTLNKMGFCVSDPAMIQCDSDDFPEFRGFIFEE